MPDPRPLASRRGGQYDDPPASDESTPRTRRNRLHHALRATEDMAAHDLAEMGALTQPPTSRRPFFSPMRRRRQRSPVSDSRNGGGSSEEARRLRPKRRKLDIDLPTPLKEPVKYGYYGQVESGKLRLEIISCDGGEHQDPCSPGTYLGPKNLLRHDKSVYCSERSSANLVLRHVDDTPFCLEKLHILGPEHGFSAPVSEGLVFVSMYLHDLSKYIDPPPHARVHGVHTPPYRRRRGFRASPERLTFSEALEDTTINEAIDGGRSRELAARADETHDPIPDLTYHNGGYDLALAPHHSGESGHGRYDVETHCDVPSTADLSNFAVTVENSSLPIALISDEEPGPEEHSSQDVLDFRIQRLRTQRRRVEPENWGRDERWVDFNSSSANDGSGLLRDASWNLRHLDAMMARSRMADSPQRDDGAEERNRQQHRGEARLYEYEAEEDTEHGRYFVFEDRLADPNVTRARFKVRRGKHRVTIKFNPPISGRFILLKLWAGRSNVDVQSVIAKGFGGARFFPAIDLR